MAGTSPAMTQKFRCTLLLLRGLLGLGRRLGRRLLFRFRLLDAGLDETRKLLLEARQPAAAVDELLLAAGPGGMRLRVDVELQIVARLAPGRARRVFASI